MNFLKMPQENGFQNLHAQIDLPSHSVFHKLCEGPSCFHDFLAHCTHSASIQSPRFCAMRWMFTVEQDKCRWCGFIPGVVSAAASKVPERLNHKEAVQEGKAKSP